MDLTLDARFLTETPSGHNWYTESLSRYLLEQDQGRRLNLILRKEAPLPEICHLYPGRTTFDLFDHSPYSINTRFELAKSVNLAGSSIFHSPFNILPKDLPIPSVMTLHELMWLIDPQSCRSLDRELVRGMLFHGTMLPRSIEESDAIVTMSQYQRNNIIQYFPQAKEKIFVGGHSPHPIYKPMQPGEHEKMWDLVDEFIPRHRRFVLMMGRYLPYKNHLRGIEAFYQAFKDKPDIDLLFISSIGLSEEENGWERLWKRPEMRKMLSLPEIRERLRLHDPRKLSREKIRALYALCDIFLFPSIEEDFGLPIIEAMATGAPVVCAEMGAMSETAGEFAVKVDPFSVSKIADGLTYLNENKMLREELAVAGPEHAAQFTPQRSFDPIIAAYEFAQTHRKPKSPSNFFTNLWTRAIKPHLPLFHT